MAYKSCKEKSVTHQLFDIMTILLQIKRNCSDINAIFTGCSILLHASKATQLNLWDQARPGSNKMIKARLKRKPSVQVVRSVLANFTRKLFCAIRSLTEL